MALRLTAAEALEQVGKSLQEQYGQDAILASKIKRQAAHLGGHQESSIIPSDFCYNRTNAGVLNHSRAMFVQEGRGRYRFVGYGYRYTGRMLHKPKGQSERVVGSWHEGSFMPAEGK